MSGPRDGQLSASDGTRLFIADWPVDNAQGGVVLMHGLGEHCGRYAHIARFFNECGWSVRSYDHRGHGRSEGARGDVPDEETILRDAQLVVDDFARQFDEPPLLLGHSMGGLFAARFATAALSPLRGLILSSPALAVPMSGMQKLLLKAMRAVAPGFGIPNGLQLRYLSHDSAVVAAYEKDPLVHPKISARLLGSMLAAIAFAHAHAATLAIPTLMVVADDDRLVDPAGSHAFFARLAPGVGTMHRYPGFYHELFNELEAQHVFDDVRQWLNRMESVESRVA
ncbi:lysophospholipase [Noviherbaspirillum cavernae]|uniref:Lysophospholipase n=1 Tax=Noviherbaspirillum cavernae TaxID=2320862 RepID=A0A418WXH5_9BURK|nr:alpha/beta hydrolase [Noviherbaspirillum cavernae]RJG04813.1 lysophospholipase [Noviherbaspirillum cavernae]